MPWYLYIAIRHLFPQGRRPTPFAILSLIGVSLGVMLLIIVISVFNGFGHEIRKIVSETSGDIKILNGGIFGNHEEMIEQLMEHPMVEAAAPVAFGKVMIQKGNAPIIPDVQGIDVVLEEKVVPIGKYIVAGSLDDLDDDSMLISSGIASGWGLYVDDEVEVITPLMINRLKQDEILFPRIMRVAGIFETNFSKIDENLIITTLRSMQDLYGMGEGVHALKVKLKDGVDADEAAIELQTLFDPTFRVANWMESNADYLGIIQFEKRMMSFLLFFIIIVGSFSIITSLLTAVVRKTREIGLYATMGATSNQIAACFCLQGFAVGVVGTALGFVVGFGVLSMRETITNLIFAIIGGKQQTMEFYFFSKLPVHIEAFDMIVIAVFSIFIATLAGLIPAYKASQLKPAEALRSE